LQDIEDPRITSLYETKSVSFIHVYEASLTGMENLAVFPKIDRDQCAKNCVLNYKCKSFDFDTLNNRCYLFSVDATDNYVHRNKHREFYQIIPPSGQMVVVKGATINRRDNLSAYRKISIKQCIARCKLAKRCVMFEYKAEHKRCDLTDITHADHNLTASIYGWDYYSMNNVKSAKHFLRVLRGSLKGSRFYSWVKNANVELCASMCMKQPQCKSFEFVIKSKNCFFSRDDASKQKKLWVNYRREFYQLEQERGTMNVIQGASIPGEDYFSRLRLPSIEDCLANCRKTPGCASVEYKASNKKCDRANITHFDFPLKASIWGWSFVEINGAPEEAQKVFFGGLEGPSEEVEIPSVNPEKYSIEPELQLVELEKPEIYEEPPLN